MKKALLLGMLVFASALRADVYLINGERVEGEVHEVNGKLTDVFPADIDELEAAKPVYEFLPGFHCDISRCRSVGDLPKEALDYIRFIEENTGCPIKYVSVGAEREACITMF